LGLPVPQPAPWPVVPLGRGGSITVTGGAVTVQGTVQAMWNPYQIRILATPTAVSFQQGGDSLLALGSGGTVHITSSSVPLLYSTNDSTAGSLDLSNTTRNITPNWATNFTVGSLTDGLGVVGEIEAGSQANSININGTGKNTPVATSTFGLSSPAPGSVTITEPSGSVVVTNGVTPVTPAELAAVVQVATTGSQLLGLTNNGDATSGSVTIAPYNVPGSVSSAIPFTTLFVPTNVTVNNQLNTLTLPSAAIATINGTMQLTTFGAPTISTSSLVMNGTINAMSGQGMTFAGGTVISGSSINLLAPGGIITLETNAISAAANVVSGLGGNIDISGSQVLWLTGSTQPLVLSANGTGTGNGGSVALTINGSAVITLGTGAAQAELSANSGSGGGNGGSVSFTASTSSLTVNTGGLSVTGASGTAGTVSLSAASYTAGSASLTANTLNLTSTGGDIGTSAAPIVTVAPNMTINASGNVFIQNTGSVAMATTIAGNLSATSTGTINITDTGTLNIINLSGTSVTINGTVGQNETINNTGTIAATGGNINITSTAANVTDTGGNLFITGGGTMNVSSGGAINLTAALSADQASANNIEFQGSQTLNGTSLGIANLTASGGNQSVIVDVGATVTGNEAVNVLSPVLMKNGTITGNPLNFGNGGTIADNTGGGINLSTLGTINFQGSLAIVSSAGITDGGITSSIDRSSGTGAGGALILVAGFNFDPPGAVASSTPDKTTTYNTFTAGIGNISLGNTAILTNGTTTGGNVSVYANGTVTIGSITTSGGSGNGGSVTIIGEGVQLNGAINTSSTSANAGNVTITAASVKTSGVVAITAGAVSGAFVANTPSGSITLAGVNAPSQTVTLTASASGGGITSAGVITAGTLQAVSGSGGIGTSGASPLSTTATNLSLNAGSAGNVFASDSATSATLAGVNAANNYNLVMTNGVSGSIVIGSGTTVTGATSVNLQASGSGTIDMQDGTGAINAPAVTLTTAGGAVGANNAIALTGASTALTVSAGAGSVAITSPNAIVLDPSTGGAVTLTANSISTSGSSTFSGLLTLNTSTITIGGTDTLTGSAVSINGVVGQDLTVNNQGNLSASSGNISIVSTPNAGDTGGNLIITGGGTMNVVSGQSINLSAAESPDELSSNIVHFTGSQTFNGTTNVSSLGDNQSVLIDSGATLTVDGPYSLTFNTTAVINNGSFNLIGQFNYNTPSGVGTYANDTGPLDLAGLSLNFNGECLAILSTGNIINSTGSPSLIDLSNVSGDGGRLYLLAGFTFTPGTGGVTTPLSGTAYTITGEGTGAINLANTTINTSGSGGGGNVYAYANGAVSLGTINTMGTGAGTNGGNVNIIGQGVTIGSNILTTGTSSSGLVSINSSTISTTGTIVVQNGLAAGGSFLPNTASGSITVAGITAGSQHVTLSAGAGGVSASGTLTAGTLTAVSGSLGIGTGLSPLVTTASTISANGGTGGDVFIQTNATSVTVTGPNGGNNYNLTLTSPASTLTVAAGQSINGVASATLKATNIAFQTGSAINGFAIDLESPSGSVTAPSAITASTDGSGNGGSITINSQSFGFANSGTQSLILNASGSGTGKGGTVAVTAQNSQTIGTSPGQIQLLATNGASGGGGGGSVSLTATGATITVADASAIQVLPQVSGSGGVITLSASSIQSAQVIALNASGAGSGGGGTITVDMTGSSAAAIGPLAGSFALTANSGAGGGGGGTVVFNTGGSLTVNASALQLGPLSGNGDGAKITLSATSIANSSSGPLVLNASGAGIGNGGMISLTTLTTSAITLGATGQFELSANAGTGGGGGGSVTFSTGGNLTVASSGVGAAAAVSGGGGNITLTAGTKGPGTLVFQGSTGINLSGVGSGPQDGGNLILQSNSTSAFLVDSSSTKNGVQGPISVTGLNGGTDGTVSITNLGGAVTEEQQLAAVGSITLASGDNGTVSVTKLLGGANTGSINLIANGSGKVTASATLQATAVDASSGSGDIGNLNVIATKVSALTSGKGTVSVTSVGSASSTLNVTGATGAAITFKSPDDLTISGPISGTAITLTSTAKTGGSIVAGGGSGKLDAVAGTGTVTITASGTGATIDTSGLTDLSAGKSITLTATKGSVTTGSIGATINPATVTVTAFNNITNAGAVDATTTITEKTTNAGTTASPSTSTISVQGNIETTSAKANTGAITLTDSGNGGITSGGFDIGGGKSVTLTATKGSISAGTIGFGSGTGKIPTTVGLTAFDNISNSGLVQAVTTITEKTTNAGTKTLPSTSAINVDGNIDTTSAAAGTGVITLTDVGNGGITNSGTANISAGKTVTLSATKGDMSVASITAGATVKATSFDQFTEATGSTIAGTTGVTISTTSITGPNHGSIMVTGITAGSAIPGIAGGAISVTAAGGTLAVGQSAIISATSNKTTKATITLENKGSTAANAGTITIGGSAQITTAGSEGSNVNIVMGTVPSKGTGNALTGVPTGVSFNPGASPSAQIFLGAPGVTFANVGSGNPIDINALGSTTTKVIFANGALTSSAITVNGGLGGLSPATLIQADPPAGSAAPSAGLALQARAEFASPMVETQVVATQVVATQAQGQAGAGSFQQDFSQQGSSPALIQAQSAGPGSGGLASLTNDFTNVPPGLLSFRPPMAPMPYQSANQPVWISDTEIASGEVPAIISCDIELGVVPQVSALVDLSTSGGASSAVSTLNHGAVVFAPTTATKVTTPFGVVTIDAGSLVLVMAWRDGLAVYDLHDRHGEAVAIDCGARVIKLFPGTQALITRQGVANFGDINPAQILAYRHVKEIPMPDGFKAFKSEFSLPMAMQAIMPLKQLARAKNVHAQRLASKLVKTAAIINDLALSGDPYQRITRTPVTCWKQ
jgi:trimeric autotransporter adhesin